MSNYKDTASDSIYFKYDQPTMFHVNELNQYTLSTYLKVGYAGRNYINAEVNSIDNRYYLKVIFTYLTDKTLDDEINVLQYTGDIEKAIPDGLGSYIVDENGYVILTE